MDENTAQSDNDNEVPSPVAPSVENDCSSPYQPASSPIRELPSSPLRNWSSDEEVPFSPSKRKCYEFKEPSNVPPSSEYWPKSTWSENDSDDQQDSTSHNVTEEQSEMERSSENYRSVKRSTVLMDPLAIVSQESGTLLNAVNNNSTENSEDKSGHELASTQNLMNENSASGCTETEQLLEDLTDNQLLGDTATERGTVESAEVVNTANTILTSSSSEESSSSSSEEESGSTTSEECDSGTESEQYASSDDDGDGSLVGQIKVFNGCSLSVDEGKLEGNCSLCGRVPHKFYQLSIAAQIKNFFENHGLAEEIDKYSAARQINYNPTVSSDLLDGSEVSKCRIGGQYDLVLIGHTDGVSISKSSSCSLWPTEFVIVIVSPHNRYKFVIVSGIWVDSCKPYMNTFLKPFVAELVTIREHGVQWTHPNTKLGCVTRVEAPGFIVDAPVRAQIQNILGVGGKHGCNMCEEKTKRLPAEPAVLGKEKQKRKRVFLYEEEPCLRTGERMKAQIKKTNDMEKQRKGKVDPVKGVKGYTVISEVPGCDAGTVFMKPVYFQHWMLFVCALNLLLQEEIPENDIERADIMLKMFVADFHNLYKPEFSTYYLHNVRHLALLVKRFGPLWSNSAFQFESFNGSLRQLIHGTKNQGQELVNNVKLACGIQILRLRFNNNPSLYQSNAQLRNLVQGFRLNACDFMSLEHLNLKKPVRVFYRAVFGKTVYTSYIYTRQKRRNNFTVCFLNTSGGKDFGMVKCYLEDSENLKVAIVKKLDVEHRRVFCHDTTNTLISHVIPTIETQEFVAVPIRNIMFKVIRAGEFVCCRPNSYEVNL
ncbi:hypothetical protein FOCC_FOCC015411 [Frankliniella occidentalis]|nr:hypothetical protein FOCC_FOCC015411 [Frankliniella occidentalis]